MMNGYPSFGHNVLAVYVGVCAGVYAGVCVGTVQPQTAEETHSLACCLPVGLPAASLTKPGAHSAPEVHQEISQSRKNR